MTDQEKQIEIAVVKRQLELLEGLYTYTVHDNDIIQKSPILKPKSDKIAELLLDIKNHIY